MALTSSSRGDKKLPTWLVLLLLAGGAVLIALASKGKPIPIQGITPTPSASVSAK